MTLVPSVGSHSASETLLLPVLVDFPDFLDSFFHSLFEGVSGNNGRSQCPECNILDLELEDG
jgi:hypothetical protein